MELNDVIEPAESPDLAPHVIEATKKERGEMYSTCSLYNVDF